MLLRYLVLFLNILVAASKHSAKQNPFLRGWDEAKRRPERGDVWWIIPKGLDMGDKRRDRVACVVLDRDHVQNDVYNFRVAKMISKTSLGPRGATIGLPGSDFFERAARAISRHGVAQLASYYRILPDVIHTVKASSTSAVMGLYGKDRVPTQMLAEAVGRLMAASEMVDGWGEDQHGPQLRGVYWIAARFFEIEAKAGDYRPCIVLKQQDKNKYIVVMMSKIPLPLPGQPALHFLEAAADVIHLVDYYIHPHENYDVEGDPKIMQKWGKGDITKLREDCARELMKSVSAIRAGRDYQHGEPIGHITNELHNHCVGCQPPLNLDK